MRIVIIGVGAMGCLFAGRISPLANVTMLGNWPEQLAALKSEGLRLIHPSGQESTTNVRAFDDPGQISEADLVLVLVKSWQSERAARQARDLLSDTGLVVTLQNGLGNLEILAKVLGADKVALGVTSEGATMIAPGIVRHAGVGLTHLARKPATADRLQEIAILFRAAGFETHLVESARSLVWGKLAVNAGINPLTALLQVPNGFLAEDPRARELMFRAAEEVAAIALALGIDLPFKDASKRALEVAQATATNRSSMAQDVSRGMPTEIEAISGAVVRYGREMNVPTPVNEAFLTLIKAQVELDQWRSEIERLGPDLQPDFLAIAQMEV